MSIKAIKVTLKNTLQYTKSGFSTEAGNRPNNIKNENAVISILRMFCHITKIIIGRLNRANEDG